MGELIRGRYERLDVVGRGGQGEVLRARDSLHDRQVALKVRPVNTPEERQAVLSEARVLLDVRPHTGLPMVREDFYVGSRYYLVMDWVEGKSLQQVLQERGDPGLAFAAVLGYLRQVAAALDHLHAHDPSVVHGDVKPSNLILTPRGQVVLVDFGVAVNEVAARRIAMGTRGYVAPELASGARPTPAADVYSLAATAYTLLTGSTPDPDDPARAGGPAGSGWPDREVARVLRQALSTDPVRRPASAGELVAVLEGAYPGPGQPGIMTFLAVEAHRAGQPERFGAAEATIGRHGGSVAGGPGPTVLGVFARATDAIGCALALLDAVDDLGEAGSDPLSLRMALHTGEAERHHDEYRGGAFERTLAMGALAADGQVLVSQVTAALARDLLLEGVSLDPVGLRPDESSRAELVFELSRTTGADPDLEASSAVTLPFERLVTAVLAHEEPPTTRNRPRGRTPTRVRWARTAVVAVLAVVVGGLVWPDDDQGASPAREADVASTIAPLSTEPPRPLPPGTSTIAAGRYETATFQPRLSFTLDGGWRSLKGESADILDLVVASGATTSLLTFVRVDRVFEPTEAPQTMEEIEQAATPGAGDIAAWLASHPRLETTAEPLEMGGRQGVRLQVTVRPGAGFPNDRCPSRCVLLFPLDTPGRLFELVEGNQNRLDVFATEGGTVVIATETPPSAFGDFRAAVDRILATLIL